MKKVFVISAIASFFAILSSLAYAANNNINILTPTNGQTFVIGSPITVSGQVNLLTGDTDTTKYGVSINWTDGTITNCLPLSGSVNPFIYTTSPSNDHAYASSGTKTIIANLFHQCTEGKDPSAASATANINLNIVSASCSLLATPSPNFGNLNPGQTSSNDESTTLSNTGTVAATSVTIQGTNWSDGDSNSMFVGQTRWSLSSGQNYDTQMTNVTSSPTSLTSSLSADSSLQIFFKLRIPPHQVGVPYTQTITFTGSC